MYGVSDAYKTAMHQAVQKFRLTGTVGTANFIDENILAGSFSITNQCCGNNEVQIGQVYVGGKMTMEKEKTAITEKYTMTVPEASAYFGIGQKKLRRLCENHTIDSFAVYSGNRYLIIRTKFEEFLQQASEI